MPSSITARRLFLGAFCVAALLRATMMLAAPPGEAPLSAPALEALVAGVALYPDPIIEKILLAAQSPADIHAAVSQLPPVDGEPRAEAPSDRLQVVAASRLSMPISPEEQAAARTAIAELAQYPSVLRQLDQHLALSAKLGVAARQQLADVWAAIDRVRVKYEAFVAAQPHADASQSANTGGGGGGGGAAYVAAPYGAFVGGLLVDPVVRELTGAATYATGQGTAGVAAAGTTTQGNTTYFGAAAAGTTTTPQGRSTTQAGVVTGSATKTENGGTISKQSAGGVVNNNTGEYAAGARSTTATAEKNSDGSISYSRDAATKTRSSYGQTDVNRSSQATVTGDGDGSFQSSTEIESSRGDATIETNAQKGEVTTTIETDQGTKTLTAGDGEIQNKPSNKESSSSAAKSTQRQTTKSPASSPSSRSSTPSTKSTKTTKSTNSPSSTNKSTGKPSTTRTSTNNPYAGVSPQQMQLAQNAHAQSWSQVSHKTSSRGPMPTQPSLGRSPGPPGPSPNLNRSTPSPSRNSPSPKGGPGGGGGGGGKRKR